jgi:sec-independent protein translocase protein TatA
LFGALLTALIAVYWVRLENTFMNAMLGIFNLGGGEIILILAVVLILFGATRIPQLMGGLGKGIKEFKKASREDEEAEPKKELK